MQMIISILQQNTCYKHVNITKVSIEMNTWGEGNISHITLRLGDDIMGYWEGNDIEHEGEVGTAEG